MQKISPGNKYHFFSYNRPPEALKKSNADFIKTLHMPLHIWFLIAAASSIFNIPVDSLLRLKNYDICLFTGTILPRLRTTSIIIVYDLVPFLFPQFFHAKLSSYYRLLGSYYRIMMPRFIRQADSVIAISNCTKKDILRIIPTDERKIHVVHPGISEWFRTIKDSSQINLTKIKYNTGEHFILFTATIEPRKNLTGLLMAFNMLCKNGNVTHKLVVVGRKGWKYEEVFQTVNEFDTGIRNRIVFTGIVSDSDLLYLYNGAALFAYPSFYEGFGLPPLEAMACGCPVVVSNTASMPEACGDAACYIDPYNVNSITEGINKVITDKGFKKALIQNGLERVKLFSWEKTAKEFLEIFNGILVKKRSFD